MLLPRRLRREHVAWNRTWGAPYGRAARLLLPRPLRALPLAATLCGPFAFQTNSDTRRHEYPWVFEMLAPAPGMRVLEIGGSNSGLQYALGLLGCEVVNVDPGNAAHGRGWPVMPAFTARLNERFGTRVELRNCFIEDAALPATSFDVAISVSTLEHIPEREIDGIVRHVARALRPGGRFVVTVDLFLDVAPFAAAATNEWGSNICLRTLIAGSGMELIVGKPDELHGFAGFGAARILAEKERYLVDRHGRVMVQAFVLRKAGCGPEER